MFGQRSIVQLLAYHCKQSTTIDDAESAVFGGMFGDGSTHFQGVPFLSTMEHADGEEAKHFGWFIIRRSMLFDKLWTVKILCFRGIDLWQK